MENIYKDLHSNQKIFIYEMLKRGINVSIIDAEREIIKTSYNIGLLFIFIHKAISKLLSCL